jgi:hypothetical protein
MADSNWIRFFPFKTGELLYVDGPLWYNGSGSVVENDGPNLEINIAMPPASILGYRIPRLEANFRIGAAKDGPGNYGKAVLNDKVIDDPNIDISSTESESRRVVDFSKMYHDKHLRLVVRRIGDHRSRLTIDGHDFTITRVVQ